MALCLVTAAGLRSGLAAAPSDDVFDIENLRVKITPELAFIEVRHDGKPVRIMRHQDPDNRVDAPYDRTSRACPPYCVQPMVLMPGVETVGELEIIEYLRRIDDGDPFVLLIDSRLPQEFKRGTIPGAVNIPYTRLDRQYASAKEIAETMEMEFGAIRDEDLWNFSAPKTLVLFCNGPWCGQSPTNIKSLLLAGYPPSRLKWYRGGMQSWEQFGFTTVKP
jgi:rhodanese-related sulfurtransferase